MSPQFQVKQIDIKYAICTFMRANNVLTKQTSCLKCYSLLSNNQFLLFIIFDMNLSIIYHNIVFGLKKHRASKFYVFPIYTQEPS